MNKRLLQLIFVLLMSVTLITGCSNGNQNGPASTPPADTKSPSGESSSEVKVQTINVWRPQNTDAIEAWWEERIADFNEKYAGQYKAVQSTFPKGGAQGYTDKVNTAVLSNSLPDVMLVDGPTVAGYAANGVILPIDEYVTAESREDIFPAMLKQGTYNGQLYTLALWDSSVALYYNKDMIEEAGITVPTKIEDAWTWDEFFDVAKRLTTSDHFGVTLHFSGGEQMTYYYSPMLVQNGTDMISPDGTTATGYLNSDRTVEFMNYIKKFYDEGVANISPTPTEFMDQKSAMFLGGAHQIATLANQYPDLNWGVTYYPKSNDGVIATPCGSWSIGISKDSKDPEAAFLLVDFMTNTEANISGCTASGYLPPRQSSKNALTQYSEEPYRVFAEQLEYGAPRPVTPVYIALSSQFSGALEDVIMGVDPMTRLNEAVEIVDKEYRDNYAN